MSQHVPPQPLASCASPLCTLLNPQVAGLSEHRAQPVHFTLKRAASNREVGGMQAGASGNVKGSCTVCAPCTAAVTLGALRNQTPFLNLAQCWLPGRHFARMRLRVAYPCLLALQEQAIAERWLEALTVCQVASGLLLR